MKRSRFVLVVSFPMLAALALAPTGAGCSGSDTSFQPSSSGNVGGNGSTATGTGGSGTSTGVGGSFNLGGNKGTGGNQGGAGPNDCGNDNPTCQKKCVGPDCAPKVEFPMPDDNPKPPNVTADGVKKDKDGYIVLDSTKSKSDNLWVADDRAYNVGFVSKVRTTKFPTKPFYREVGRYVSVTCFSDAVNGSKEGAVLGKTPPNNLCSDGMNGCCARDAASGAKKGVQLLDNRPSRTAVDINGDMWVANRAHGSYGKQASVTKIANDPADCIDRNNNNKIDTSSDVNNDGIITTDCNDDNIPDDINTVCSMGKSHEFFGLDDECILFTVNIGAPGGTGRPLALGPDPLRPTGPSDAWAGLYSTGQFFRIDGVTGKVEATVQLKTINGHKPNPYGAAVDFYGILWAPSLNTGRLHYFDTNQPTQQGMVTSPVGGGFYGIALDGYSVQIPDDQLLIQQIWMGDYSGGAGAGAIRYRPVRDKGFFGLSQGTWAKAVFDKNPNTSGFEVRQGRGLGADNRAPKSFVWLALDGYATNNSAHVGRIPIDVPDNATTILGPNDMMDSTQRGMTGANVAADLDVWGVNQQFSTVVHFGVDPAGNKTSGPDIIPLDDKPNSPENFCGFSVCKPRPYTYSDFTGFGLRNFTVPKGYWSWVETGKCPAGQTEYLKVIWDAEVPKNTAITMIARTAKDLASLKTATWTAPFTKSPADLKAGGLTPNPSTHMEVLFELTTKGQGTPKLKSFQIVYQCTSDVPN